MASAIAEFGTRCRGILQSGWRAGLDFVYPRVCPRCSVEDERTVSASRLEPVFCRSCSDELAPAIPHSCARCAAPVGPFLDTSSGCIHCRGERWAFGSVVRLGVYENALRSLCLVGKNPGAESSLAAAAAFLFERECDALKGMRADVIVPVPHHWTQRLGRSHNSAEVIGGVLARRLRVECDAGLVRKIRRTPPQASLPSTQRRTNLRGAFRTLAGCDLSGCRVLIADDVLTTGSTVNEVAKALRKSGAEVVAAVVLARAVR